MTPSNAPTLTFLIVDDHAPFRATLKGMVVMHPGWLVAGEAGNGREAVRLAQLHRPDVVLMDIAMPEVNGIQATRQMRALMLEMVIILITAYHNQGFLQSSHAVGTDLCVRKEELTAGVLSQLVRDVLQRRRSPTQAPGREPAAPQEQRRHDPGRC